MKIEGCTAVVTGGGSGIGKGLCERLMADGAEHVVVADIDGDAAAAVAEQVGGTAVTCDVADEASVQALAARAVDAMGRIDLFCANAGIGTGGGFDTDDTMWERSWQINVMGVVRCARAVIPQMTDQGGGTIMVTASAAGLVTGPVSFNYAASKHAVIGVAEWLSLHHGPTIKVSALCPTIVDTPMLPEFGDALVEPLTVEQVVDAAVVGLQADQFMITPWPQSVNMHQAKAADWNAFHDNMRNRLSEMGKKFGP